MTKAIRMKIEDLRPQFAIYILADTLDHGTMLKTQLSESGYEVLQYSEEKPLLQRVEQAVPHIVLFSFSSVFSELRDFVTRTLQISSEILFIPLVKPDHLRRVLPFKQNGFLQPVVFGENLAERVQWAVDEACERLYINYQNEFLYNQMQNSEVTKSIPRLIQTLARNSGHSDLIDELLFMLSGKISQFRGVFFKHLQSVHAFVATHAIGVEIDSIRGVASPMAPEEARDIYKLLLQKNLPQSLTNFANKTLPLRTATIEPLFFQTHIEGVFVFWSESAPLTAEALQPELSLFGLIAQTTYLTQKLETFDQADPVTQLLTKPVYGRKLEEELGRAKRIDQPISVIRMLVDRWDFIDIDMGPVQRDLVLRSIANLIKRTSRGVDISCRTLDREFSLILPHCGAQGALVRAERLRKLIEEKSFSMTGLRVTVSQAVTEYPNLSSNFNEVELALKKALSLSSQNGGNKIALFKPSPEK